MIDNEINSHGQVLETEPAVMVFMPKFSFYKAPVSNTLPHAEISLPDAYKVIKGGWYQRRTAELRTINDMDAARKFKATHFDYGTFSGEFTKRSDACLTQHSGLMALDFDHVANLEELKEILLGDQYFETELMFISPSGDGLKWIVPIDLQECSHAEWFHAIAHYLKTTYRLEVDKSGKDISRACFLPHDQEVYLHPKYKIPSNSKPFNTSNHATL